MGRKIRTTDSANKRNGDLDLAAVVRLVKLENVALASSGDTDADLGSIRMPGRWKLNAAFIVGKTMAGSAATAVIDLRTAAAGGGASLIDVTSTNATLNTVTATGKYKNLTPLAQTDVLTATRVYLRQTTDSGNAAAVDLYLEIYDLTDF